MLSQDVSVPNVARRVPYYMVLTDLPTCELCLNKTPVPPNSFLGLDGITYTRHLGKTLKTPIFADLILIAHRAMFLV